MPRNKSSIPDCLVFVFKFCVFAQCVPSSDGFGWVYQPESTTYGEIGSRSTEINWHYNLSHGEKFRSSSIKSESKRVADRHSGEDKYTVRPAFSGYKVIGETNITLVLPRLAAKHEGQYCCFVEYKINSSLYEKKNCTTLITYALPSINITDISTNITANVSDSLLLQCKSSGKPPPEVWWTKLGSTTIFSRDSKLYLNNTVKEQAGEYECKARNKHGQTTAKFVVSLQFKPNMTFISRDTIVTEGGNVTLKCMAEGLPKPVMTWSRDGGTIISYSSHLHLQNVTRSHSKTYRCTATNILGQVRSWVSVNVLYMPDIVFITSMLTVNETNSVTLQCNATGNPIPDVQWFKQGKPMSLASGNSATYVITNSGHSNTGDYQCKANNTVETVSQSTTLVIQYKPRITGGIQNRNLTEGDLITLTCIAIGHPVPLITWTYMGSHVQHSNNVSINVSRGNDGPVTCTARNILGEDQKSAVVTVFYPPELLVKPSNVILNITGDIELSCNASGKPPPMITWTRHGSSAVLHTGPSYRKPNATKDDAGLYRCTADNGVGRPVHVHVMVVVHFVPTVVATNKLVKSWIGHPVELVCIGQGAPRPVITWSRHGREMNSFTNSSTNVVLLTFIPQSSNDFGVYTCWAQNFMGKDNDSIVVTELKRPGPPTILNVETTKDSVEIHWSSPKSDGGSHITKYLVQISTKEGPWSNCTNMRKAGENWSCSLGNLDIDTEFVVKVFARNQVGLGEPVKRDFRTLKSGTSDSNKRSGKSSKKVYNDYVFLGIGLGLGAFLVIAMSVVIVRKQRRTQQTELPIELNRTVVRDSPNAHDGPALSASNQSLETNNVNENERKGQDVAL